MPELGGSAARPAPPGKLGVMSSAPDAASRSDFIRDLIDADNQSGRFDGRVHTRFPPEPNGYLHIGHAKSICLNFELATQHGGEVNLRFDDTNPTTEDTEFVRAIEDDIEWLGYTPSREPLFASNYFEQLYDWAELLIGTGKAYVDDQDAETISAQRGGFTTPGTNSPYRDRTPDENRDLFRRMRAGEFPDGSRVLRAKIDMDHENMQMRDPVLYRIRHAHHFRTGSDWVIYPTYDWAHGQSDAIEGITHSLCTLEFDSHRRLYDWCLDQLEIPADRRPYQSEFARLALTHTILSKRKLMDLVNDGHVDGWDDPRMPTLRGMRRRGYPASAIRDFCAHIGIAKMNGTHEIELLESFVRSELNHAALRRSAVLRPLKVVLTNWPDGHVELRDAVNNPDDDTAGLRQVPFSGTLYIERDDFMEEPAPKYYRLAPGREVRLRYGYFITCDEVIKDDSGEIVELRCTYDPETSGGQAPDGRKVKATLHWVSASHAIDTTVALYDRLFSAEFPGQETGDPLDDINPNSIELIEGAKAEPALADAEPGSVVQFERLGYFAADPRTPMLFHRTVGLRDEWANIQKRKKK
jgi:glutaminyl-tRNA synthetase